MLDDQKVSRPDHAITLPGMPTRPRAGAGSFLLRLFDGLLTWQERYETRRHLRRLDDRMLKDIGLSRADVEMESAKPFWMA